MNNSDIRKNLKKKMAFMLALSMMSGFSGTVAAAENVPDADAGITENGNSEPENIGRVEVSLGAALLINPVDFVVSLTDGNRYSDVRNVNISKTDEEKIIFDNLAAGEYTVTISAAGFRTFSQNITVKNKLYTMRVTTDFCGGYEYEDGGKHPGVILIGDVDGNGKIDNTDKNILIDVIDGQPIPDGCTTDLNRDGNTDLRDLMFFSKGYKNERNTTAATEEFISPLAVNGTVSENTNVDGDISKMIRGEESITLKPANKGTISEENPVSISLDIDDSEESSVVDGITIATGNDTAVEDAMIDVEYVDENGEEQTIPVPLRKDTHFLLKESEVYAELDKNGNIQVHLCQQVAVKKVTLTITAMQQGSNNLAEISKVEFVNGMEDRIPEPALDIPLNLTATPASSQFTLNWDPCVNVTSYQVKVEANGITETIPVTSNSVTVTSFGGKEIRNYTEFTVSVQSVNGTWKSDYCKFVKVTPMPNKRPDKPDRVSATGGYRSISVSWAKMKDTRTYNLYYKLRDSDDEYTKIPGITTNKYDMYDLSDCTEYEIYVTGENELGEGPASIHCAATTISLDSTEVPRYKMISRDENGVPDSSHIVSAKIGNGFMADSELDKNSSTSAWGTVDRNEKSYYQKDDWDDGVSYYGSNKGMTYTFDKAYEMNTISLISTKNASYSNARVKCWNEGKEVAEFCVNVSSHEDAKGKPYQMITLPQKVTADKVQICLTTGYRRLIAVSEVYFYHYDGLMDEVMGLYVDDLHTVLRDDVTQEDIDALREKVDEPDEFGEMNFNRDSLLREIETAEKILNDESLRNAVEIHNGISTSDVGRGFGGLNAWQPLGVTAESGETVTIYVGSDTRRTGDNTNLQVIATQYHAESNGVIKRCINLKVGANEFFIPTGSSSIGFESGGALYIQYTGNNVNDKYSVRVSGGTQVPCLDLYKVTDENERMARAVEYIEALDRYVPEMENRHNEIHKNSGNRNVDYDYDHTNCILGASDILLDTMMFSLPAPQILAGTGNGSVEERAERLLNSMNAMNDMMYLFYQHKGLNASARDAVNQIPKGHLNVRYQRMFSGAFMYASGNHIGIEWGSTSGMVTSQPVVADENGKYLSGRYFGWGIAHEIGHCINQGTYAVAEITNNYFSVLAQAKDTNNSVRFSYDNVYKKVSSGKKGAASNVFTQLAMYWQLHLAYDRGLNYKTYSDYNEQLDNLFYARVDTYSRTPNTAPAPNGIKLTLNGGTDQNLMRLACAASEKNLLEFFRRWGKSPDQTTIQYAEQFEKETRAIFYANDDARVYSLNGESVLGTDSNVRAIESASVNIGKSSNQVEMNFVPCGIPEDDILGYDIVRCTYSGGKVEEIPVGFATGNTFTDTVTTMNNRTVFYKVTLIDKYLNRSETVATDTLKIEHDGSMDKSGWSVTTSGLVAEAVTDDAHDGMPCEQTVSNPAEMVIDHNFGTVYEPSVTSDSAEIVMDFNQTFTVSGLKYTAGNGNSIGKYEVYVCENGEWILTADGTFNGSKTIYFANDDDKYISTYSATAVKLVITGQKNQNISIAEIDVLSVTGDNVDFRRTSEDRTTVIGTLGEAYQYGENPEDVIPEGSLIFTGAYKGNPAYSTVILYDTNGNVVGGFDADGNVTAQQIILADVPDGKNITDVSNGTWVYWIEPEQMSGMEMPEVVRAELYRVNNALTNEGQRLVSDTLCEEVPDTLPVIVFNAD